MIGCVCLNCAVDITYHVDALVPGTSHRVHEVHAHAGGKGINVARVLNQLGAPCLVMGFVGGGAGSAIVDDLSASNISHHLTSTAAESRRTVTVVADSATVLNESGGPVTSVEWTRLRHDFEQACSDLERVVLSGSLPAGVPGTAYAELTEIAHHHGVSVLLDAEGAPLFAGLEAQPDLVKPNDVEVAELLGRPVISAQDAADAGRELLHRGAGSAVISRGADGVVAVRGDQAMAVRLPDPVRGNPTGAGDALAAVLASHQPKDDWRETLQRAVAVSAAAVMSPVAGEFAGDVAERLRPQVEIEEL